jgi:XTP/dITP diphosphohydrolase
LNRRPPAPKAGALPGCATPRTSHFRAAIVSFWAAMAATDLLLASQNPGKLAEMKKLVEGLPFRILVPKDVGIHDAPEETGTTFAENAASKARHYARRSGLLTVADDSGIAVDALGGEPGLYSSRFGGEGATDEDRNRLLLQKLMDLPAERRGAHFTSSVALAEGDAVVFQATESVRGSIAEAPRGPNGFGYDPIFFFPPYGKTFGEVDPDEKDRVSHRGKAFARLKRFLATMAQS